MRGGRFGEGESRDREEEEEEEESRQTTTRSTATRSDDVRCGFWRARGRTGCSARGEDAVDEFRLASADALPRAKDRLEFGDGERRRVGGFARGCVRGERARRVRAGRGGDASSTRGLRSRGVGDASKRAARVPGLMMMTMVPRRSRSRRRRGGPRADGANAAAGRGVGAGRRSRVGRRRARGTPRASRASTSRASASGRAWGCSFSSAGGRRERRRATGR